MVEPHIHFSVVNGFSSGPTAAAALGEFGRNAFIFHVKGEAYIATTAAFPPVGILGVIGEISSNIVEIKGGSPWLAFALGMSDGKPSFKNLGRVWDGLKAVGSRVKSWFVKTAVDEVDDAALDALERQTRARLEKIFGDSSSDDFITEYARRVRSPYDDQFAPLARRRAKLQNEALQKSFKVEREALEVLDPKDVDMVQHILSKRLVKRLGAESALKSPRMIRIQHMEFRVDQATGEIWGRVTDILDRYPWYKTDLSMKDIEDARGLAGTICE